MFCVKKRRGDCPIHYFPFDLLPDDIKFHTLGKYLELCDVLICDRVSRRFKYMANCFLAALTAIEFNELIGAFGALYKRPSTSEYLLKFAGKVGNRCPRISTLRGFDNAEVCSVIVFMFLFCSKV